ncbi:MAG: hypothetical protein KQH53_11290 [Desulfarculaceae bacterium]|nr:hypothetical protein [Desulfarculaceae bacterium]
MTTIALLALALATAAPAVADELGDKLANFCLNSRSGQTLTLSSSESSLYDQHTSSGGASGDSVYVSFSFKGAQGQCLADFSGSSTSTSVSMNLHKTEGSPVVTLGERRMETPFETKQ